MQDGYNFKFDNWLPGCARSLNSQQGKRWQLHTAKNSQGMVPKATLNLTCR